MLKMNMRTEHFERKLETGHLSAFYNRGAYSF